MSRRKFLYQADINSPLGEKSAFYNVFVDLKDRQYDIPIPTEKQFRYQIMECNSGLDVFKFYESDAYSPDDHFAYIFVEKEDPEKSNFFGTVCRAKMGNAFRLMIQKSYNRDISVSVNDATVLAKNLNEFAQDIAQDSGKVNATDLYNAFLLELNQGSVLNEAVESLFGLNNKLADWMATGIESIEKWKLTEENYDYQKYYLSPNYNLKNDLKKDVIAFKPLIPVPMVGDDKSEKIPANDAITHLQNMYDHFDELAMGIVVTTVAATPTLADDILLPVIYYVKNYLEEQLTGPFKIILAKAKSLLQEAIAFVKKIHTLIIEKGAQAIALVNALLCGIINGLLSLLQTILALLSFVVDNISFLELEELSPKAKAAQQEKLEFLEDMMDVLTKNATTLFIGITTTLLSTKVWNEIATFVMSLWNKGVKTLKESNEYFWAFVVGAIIFEVLVEVAMAVFTGGTGNVAKAVAKISRAADKAKDVLKQGAKVGKKIAKETGESLASIWQFFKREFEELIEAIKSGEFVKWLKKKFYELTGDVEGLRKLALAKYLDKFDDFFRHFNGEITIGKFSKRDNTPALWLEGAHNFLENGKKIKIGKIRKPQGVNLEDIPDDIPFIANVEMIYAKRNLPKKATSSFFPKNWNITRVKEEIALVYDDLILSGKDFSKFPFKHIKMNSEETFEILIEFDKFGNITNAYPNIKI